MTEPDLKQTAQRLQNAINETVLDLTSYPETDTNRMQYLTLLFTVGDLNNRVIGLLDLLAEEQAVAQQYNEADPAKVTTTRGDFVH